MDRSQRNSNNNPYGTQRRPGSKRTSGNNSRYTQRGRPGDRNSGKDRDRGLGGHAVELQTISEKDGPDVAEGNAAVPGGDPSISERSTTRASSSQHDGSPRRDHNEHPDGADPHVAASAKQTHLEIMTFVSKQKNKSSFLRELFRHIIFTGIFIAILFMQRNVFNSFIMNTALQTAYVTQTIDASLQPFPKTFTDVGEWSELRDYMLSIIGGTLDNNQSYTGADYSHLTDTEYVEQGNRLLGGVRLRQLRVKPDTCYVDGQPTVCYPLYHDASTRDTAPFGPPYNRTKYKWQEPDQCVSASIIGNNLGVLEGPGYIVDIPLYSEFTAKIQELIDDGWWDISTRAIIITMNYLNVHLGGYVSVVYLIIEMPPGGTVYPAYMMKTFRLDLYATSLDYFRLALEIIFLILLAVSLYAELKQIYEAVKKSGFKGYLRSLWNILEIVNLILFGITVGMYIDSVMKSRKFRFNLPREHYFCDLEYLASGALNFYNINAANIILTVFHTFKYLQLNRRLYILWKTLRHAGTDLLGFFFIFFVFTIGFLFMGWITFGPDTTLFNTFPNSFATCWTFVMGNAPDYDTLSSSNRLLGPAFFTLFTIFVFFILANMFIAIISDSFSQIHSDGAKKQLKLTEEIEKTINSLITRVKQLVGPREEKKVKPKQILELLNNLKNPDILSKEDATLEEIKGAIGGEATDADALELKNWYDKLRSKNKAKQQGGHHPSDYDDDSPQFSEDEYYDEPAPYEGGAALYSEDLETMMTALSKLTEQVQTIHATLQVLNEKIDRTTLQQPTQQQPPQ